MPSARDLVQVRYLIYETPYYNVVMSALKVNICIRIFIVRWIRTINFPAIFIKPVFIFTLLYAECLFLFVMYILWSFL